MNRRNSRSRRAAFTLPETLIVTFIVAMIGTLMMQLFSPSMKASKVVGSKATLLQQARYGMDTLVSDIRGSAGVVSSYGGYNSGDNALILRAPSYDSSYRQITGSYDYIIYRRVGTSAPYTLVRRLVLASGSARPAQAAQEVTLVQNVASLSFTCLAQQTITGDGTTKSWPLLSVSLQAALTSLLTNPLAITAANVQIYDFVIANALVTFTTAPSLGAKIRLLYRVQPTSSAIESYISSVDVTLRLADPDASLTGASAPNLEFTGGANLRNID